MDANHDQPIEEDDLPALVGAHRERALREAQWQARDTEADWTGKWWFADAEAIRETDFNLSAGRHRPHSRATTEHRDPLQILGELKGIEAEIVRQIDALGQGGDELQQGDAIPLVRLDEVCQLDRRHVRATDSSASQLPFLGLEHVAAGTGVIDLDSDSRVGDQKKRRISFRCTACSLRQASALPQQGRGAGVFGTVLNGTDTASPKQPCGSRFPRSPAAAKANRGLRDVVRHRIQNAACGHESPTVDESSFAGPRRTATNGCCNEPSSEG